jgi:hypothetical protein
VLTTQVGNLTLAIPKLPKGSFFPNWLEPHRRVDKALYAVVMEAYTRGNSTRKVDALVEALGGASGISKSEVSSTARGWTSRSRPSWAGHWTMPVSVRLPGRHLSPWPSGPQHAGLQQPGHQLAAGPEP